MYNMRLLFTLCGYCSSITTNNLCSSFSQPPVSLLAKYEKDHWNVKLFFIKSPHTKSTELFVVRMQKIIEPLKILTLLLCSVHHPVCLDAQHIFHQEE